jgi:deoxyribodipyrimidine photo-lyase
MKQKANIFWFRRDLRLFDNHGLFKALSDTIPVLPVFIFDTNILKQFPNSKDRRFTFIYQQLANIHKELKKHGSGLTILHSSTNDAFEKLFSLYDISKIYSNTDYEPNAIQRDTEIANMCTKRACSFLQYKDQVIFEKNEIVKNDSLPYTVFTPYMKKWKIHLKTEGISYYDSYGLLSNMLQYETNFSSIEEIGYHKVHFEFPTIEYDKSIIQSYDQTRDFPGLNGTSRLGIHFRFGTISIREAVQKALEWNEAWLNELIWREFFMQILWHFPYVENQSFAKKYQLFPWQNNESDFEKWCKAETGYPIVDAGIIELISTGYMHNRVRMVVANFLTKILLIDWRWGEAFFAEHLLDYELSSNNGNWQWAAGTGADAAPYFRIFNPTTQAERFDKQGTYIQKYTDTKSYKHSKMIDYTFARNRCLETFKLFRKSR